MTHPVDLHVGTRIRQRRWLMGITQQQLALTVGIKFQQIQKYESGKNRVSASRLYDIGCALGVPVAYFFQDLHEGETNAPEADEPEPVVFANREAHELARHFLNMPSEQRHYLLELSRVMVDGAA